MISFREQKILLEKKCLVQKDVDACKQSIDLLERHHKKAVCWSTYTFAGIVVSLLISAIIKALLGVLGTGLGTVLMYIFLAITVILCVCLAYFALEVFAVLDGATHTWVPYPKMQGYLQKKLEQCNQKLKAVQDEMVKMGMNPEATTDRDLQLSSEEKPMEPTVPLFGAETMSKDIMRDEEGGLVISLEDAWKTLREEDDEPETVS